MTDAINIGYTSGTLSHIGVTNGMNLAQILASIDSAVNSMNPAPDYSGYNLYCVTQTDGVSHPTDTQNFAEGISKVLCDFKTAYTTFTGTTYVTDQGVITAAINGITNPAITYVPFGITNTDTLLQVLNKNFSGITAIVAGIDVNLANWASIGYAGAGSLLTAFNQVIAYELTQDALIAAKQASLGSFDTTVIGGTVGVSPIVAINTLISYASTLPVLDLTGFTWGCVTPAGNLSSILQSIVNSVDYNSNHAVTGVGAGLSLSPTGCGGRTASIDNTWGGLYKVAIDSTDVTNATYGYLKDKLTSNDNSVTITVSNTHDTLDLSVPAPDGKVKVASADGSPDYLLNKVEVVGDTTWGLVASKYLDQTGTKVIVDVKINRGTFINTFFDYIQDDPDLLSRFCAIKDLCVGCNCNAPTSLIVTPTIV